MGKRCCRECFCKYERSGNYLFARCDKTCVTAFSIPSTSTSLLVSVTSFTASDNKAVTGLSAHRIINSAAGRKFRVDCSAPTSYSFATEGTKTLYAWAKDAAGNVSASMSGQVTISLPDVTKPVVTAFTIPSTFNFLVGFGN
jgi:trimeric autotransporter adhesin